MNEVQIENNNVTLETLFYAHLSVHQNPESMLKAPVDSYVALTEAIAECDKAFNEIPVFEDENIVFLLAPFIIVAHYYLGNKWLFHNDWFALGIFGTVFLIPFSLVYFFCGFKIGSLTNKFRIQLWKRKKINKPIVNLYEVLTRRVEKLSEVHDSVCQEHFNEKNYFQCMFNFDQMAERITHHSVYTPAFYGHKLYTKKINLPEIRDNLKEAYLSGNSTEFFNLYYQSLQLEETVAQAWVKFEAQDGEILEEKYQAFARTHTGALELQDII